MEEGGVRLRPSLLQHPPRVDGIAGGGGEAVGAPWGGHLVRPVGGVPQDGHAHAGVSLEAEREDGDDDEEHGKNGHNLEAYSRTCINAS